MSILTNFPCQNQILYAFVRFLLSGVSICPGEHMSVNRLIYRTEPTTKKWNTDKLNIGIYIVVTSKAVG